VCRFARGGQSVSISRDSRFVDRRVNSFLFAHDEGFGVEMAIVNLMARRGRSGEYLLMQCCAETSGDRIRIEDENTQSYHSWPTDPGLPLHATHLRRRPQAQTPSDWRNASRKGPWRMRPVLTMKKMPKGVNASNPASSHFYIGTAGWTVSSQYVPQISLGGSHLERYARHLNAVEINSSFYKPHRVETYIRWAQSTPAGFRFAVKAPRTVTHERRLIDCDELLDAFAAQIRGLGPKLGLVLLQLPPTLAFEPKVAETFIASLQLCFSTPVAIEPRHASWFVPEINQWLGNRRIVRVAADPPIAPGGGEPGGWRGLTYHRCHGSPNIYFSAYDYAALTSLRTCLCQEGALGAAPAWCVFDNTGSGAALGNALMLAKLLSIQGDQTW
jgi:uncharacterized protein YecE (DUF72 family)